MKKGFTLIELLAVIVVIGILGLISLPPIINMIKNMRDNVSDATLKIINSAAYQYITDNSLTYPMREDASYCITLESMVLDNKLSSPIIDAQTGIEVPLTNELLVDIGTGNDITYTLLESGECDYIDPSFAEAPDLVDGMIPIIWDAAKWVKADITSDWYSYNDKEWANAVLVTSASRAYYRRSEPGTEILEADILMYYVWVPRFRYKIKNATNLSVTPSSFEIIFEGSRTTKSNGSTNGSWKTHPAFTFNSVELNGIWVAKFEAGYYGANSAGNAQRMNPEENKLISKPNTYSWRNITISNMHIVTQELNDNGNMYGLNSTSDVHVAKNSEWGAIAYLTYSIYGKNSEVWINSNSDYKTGCAGASVSAASSTTCNLYGSANGLNASSTGNIYGIYDLSGGAHEYVMADQYNSGSNINLSVGGSGFSQAELDAATLIKYINKYNYGTTSSDQTAYNRSQLGDAMGETRGWNSDTATMIYDTYQWVIRSGGHTSGTGAGIFYFYRGTGGNDTMITFRPIIVKQ